MDVETDDAISEAELLAVQASVHKSVERIARALHDRQGQGRSPAFLKELSALEAVTVDARSSVLSFEAPHDTEQFPIDFGESDAGVQAIELFVQAVGVLLDGEDLAALIGDPAERSVRAFVGAVGTHDRVSIEASVGKTDTALTFDPHTVPRPRSHGWSSRSLTTLSFVGRLYGINLLTHSFRFKDELGRTRFLTVSGDLDEVALGRTLLGEIVYVGAETAAADRDISEHFVATTIEPADHSMVAEFQRWELGTAATGVESSQSTEELRIPGLDVDGHDDDRQVVAD
jgi:hypothetical protein